MKKDANHPSESSLSSLGPVVTDVGSAKSLSPGSGVEVDRDETGFYEAYAGFSRTLRTWLVAYGIGAPVLFITQANAADALRRSGLAREVAMTFLAGVAIQVLGALLYKTTMWHLYMHELWPSNGSGRAHEVFVWISEAYGLEFAIDAAAIVTFGWATWRTVVALT